MSNTNHKQGRAMTSDSYELLRKEGYALAGGLDDLRRRARVYHRMYQDSGKRNVFPLIAAHGTVWALGYFKKGLLGAQLATLPYLFMPRTRAAKLRAIADFADSFRDINRRVCAESYAVYHYTKRYGGDSFIRSVIGDGFADILGECHASGRLNSPFSQERRERLFAAFINWEQERVVAPLVTETFKRMYPGLIKFLALRPRIHFSYFGKNFRMQFDNFASQGERVEQGLQAYRHAEAVGLEQVERALDRLPGAMPGQEGLLRQFRFAQNSGA